MKLRVERRYRLSNYTIGKLYIDNAYFCDTLEDTDRGLDSSMSLEDIQKAKVKGATCIPYGTYKISLSIKSNKYSNFAKYKYAAISAGYMPRIMGVKGFDGILIHAGNTAADTDGCLLVGYNKVKGKVVNSQDTWTKLYNKLKGAVGTITIEFTK